MCNTQTPQSLMPGSDTHIHTQSALTHKHTLTELHSCVISPVPSWTRTNNGGEVDCGILKLPPVSDSVSPASLSTKHTPLLPPTSLLKQHREQGLWIINTPKFLHISGQRCPSGKQCWCVEEQSHGGSLGEYKIHVQTQHRTERGASRKWAGPAEQES